MHYRTTPAFSPRVRPFDNPAPWQGDKSSGDFCNRHSLLRGLVQDSRRAVSRAPYDFNTDMVPLLDVASTRPAVRTVGVKLFESRRLGTRLRDNRGGGIPVLHACGSHCHCNDQAHRIDHEITLSPFDLFACIEATFAPLRRTAIGLCIDDGCGRPILTAHA
jgi:hypothetical protein